MIVDIPLRNVEPYHFVQVDTLYDNSLSTATAGSKAMGIAQEETYVATVGEEAFLWVDSPVYWGEYLQVGASGIGTPLTRLNRAYAQCMERKDWDSDNSVLVNVRLCNGPYVSNACSAFSSAFGVAFGCP